MRFRLATLLWVVSFAAVLLAWYAEHSSRNRREILGTWHYPTRDLCVLGYRTRLEIRSDGTFEKYEGKRLGSTTFRGTYFVDPAGCIIFEVQSKTDASILDQASGTGPQTTTLSEKYYMRCAVDKTGLLIVAQMGHFPVPSAGSRIRWDNAYEKR